MSILRTIFAGALALTSTALNLGIGINMGNTLEAPEEGQWAPGAQSYYFDDYKSAGFDTVRIPVRWDNHTALTPPYTINATWMSRVQTVVGWCTDRGFQCIINSHWDSWLDVVDPVQFEAMLPRYRAIWEQVSATFSSAPESLYFESFNEPHNMNTTQLNAMLSAFYTAVRPSNPDRMLILGWLNYMGPSWIEETNRSNWDAMTLPGGGSDSNLALEVHSYDPYMSCGKGTVPWGSHSDLENMAFMFTTTIAAWSAAHNVPFFFGECGCVHTQVNRLPWYSTFFQYAKNSTGSAGAVLWDDDGAWLGIYNRSSRKFDEAVLAAIGL